MKFSTDKACGRILEFIHKDIMQKTTRSVSNAQVISLMFDGAELHMFRFVEIKKFVPGLLTMRYLKICL